MRDLYLAIDVGTGGIRAALVDKSGHILKICHREHEQIVPHFGWSEQRPADWWHGTIETVREVIHTVDGAADRVAGICTCGQMHGSVLIDDDGQLTREAALLWNDKRTLSLVERFEKRSTPREFLSCGKRSRCVCECNNGVNAKRLYQLQTDWRASARLDRGIHEFSNGL